MNESRLLAAANDCIALFRSARYPLQAAADSIIKSRKLNSRDRKSLLRVVFDFAREILLFEHFLKAKMPFSLSLSRRQKDAMFLEIVFERNLKPEDQEASGSLKKEYDRYLHDLKDDRFLLALGFIGAALKKDYGMHAPSLAQGLLRTPKKYLAWNKREVTLTAVYEALKDLGIAVSCHDKITSAVGIDEYINSEKIPESLRRHVWFMDAGSQMIAALIKPHAHEWVLDMCSGEGNKAHYITQDPCHYVAVDMSEKRLNIAKKRIKGTIDFIVADARKLPFADNTFDWILLDAPCSGSGTLARAPDIVLRLTHKDIDAYQRLQYELLNSAIKLLKPHGKLIYATCSLLQEENEHQISRILKENSNLKPLSLREFVSRDVNFTDEELDKNSMTILPHVNQSDGYYFAALTKINN